ncbi:hypothetical protein [Enterococcus ureasiticus]|uniref:Uncharacterized protein n=1 Tax=Enterococcus ureasiticus TaxID=903984 RepID=A0A1E5GH47_9ENTE|nr:hypothetical protein [Enterococcus ureasiticus]OEG12032.1 hypothetical protein BCR21_07285 [Enterococcus ureasiticus]
MSLVNSLVALGVGAKQITNVGKGKAGQTAKKPPIVDSGTKVAVETTTNNKLPTIHKPNTVIKRVDENGKLISERIFDENGRVIKDIHHTDHGNPKLHPKVPHEHTWDWSDPKKQDHQNNRIGVQHERINN